jgi:AraC-like DNA-binding protein
MDTVLFNFHDVLMLLTAFQCLLFALLLTATKNNNQLSNLLLVGFLLCHFFIPLHELMFWGKQFRIWLLELSPNGFFLFSHAYFLDGPLIYFFVRALLYKDFRLKAAHSWHLLPLAIYAGHMLHSFYLQDHATKSWLIESQHIAYSSPHLYFEALGRFLRIGYVLWCFSLVLNYRRQLQQEHANLRTSEVVWLKLMLVSFLIIFGWDGALLSIKLYGLLTNNFNLELLNVVGLSSYYLNFTAINILIFLRFTSFSAVPAVHETPMFEAKEEKLHGVDPQIMRQLEQLMTAQHFYANPDITLEKLAEAAGYPAKKVSLTIKQGFQLNFYEYVNSHRITAAKLLLADHSAQAKSITEIYFAVGFNSKSVFNTFFKRLEGMTPSQFRDQHHKAAS